MSKSFTTRTLLFVVGSILLLAATFCLKSYMSIRRDLEKYQHDFVSARWKDRNATDSRHEMLQDLQGQLEQIHPTRDQALALLGSPDAPNYALAEGISKSKGCSVVDGYIVGSAIGDGMRGLAFQMFCVGYDRDGRFVAAWVMKDETLSGPL